MTSFRNAAPNELAIAMERARSRTLELFECCTAAGFEGKSRIPMLDWLNPPLWELGHIAWFAEWYILRAADSSAPTAAQRTSMLTKGDDWFDPNTVPHRARRGLELPSAGAMKTYCHEVLDRALDKLGRSESDDAALYPYRLSLAYEDLRGEAMLEGMQVMDICLPPHLAPQPMRGWAQGEIRFPGGTITLGSPPDGGFVFDNEKWAHACHVPAFVIDSTLVSHAQFADFVTDGGYQNASFWSPAGRAWLMAQDRQAPRDWLREGRHWRCVRFGRDVALPANEPVRHINLYEAQAYCRWIGRRLPTEAEWEYAVSSGHPAFRWGDLREWTCSSFEPYPGFAPDAYREYSEPNFVSHQAVRGASFATPARLRSVKMRGFALPERDNMFVGFRTCAM